MFLRKFYLTRWCARLAAVAVVFCLMAIPNKACSQGISIAGVGEASVMVLAAGGAAMNLAVTATPSVPAGSTNVIFVLERQGSVLLNRTSPPPYAVTFSNLTAGKYFLTARLSAAGTPPSGDVSFDINAASSAPANDNWSQATVMSLNTTLISSNTYATSEVNEPVHGGVGAGKSVWWAWSAVSDGVFTATTAGSGFDTVLGVYTGTSLGTLTEVSASDDAGVNPFSQVTFAATNGTVYYFAVDSASAAGFGKAQLRLLAGSPPAISITSPADGYLMLVSSPTTATNITATATVTDPAGVARVDYWFDGTSGMSRSGILSSPYQLSLTNLTEGHYTLTLAASNNAGLVSVTNTGFSVISLAPVLVTEGFTDSSKQFQLAVTGFKGPNYSVQASSNLDAWCSLKTFTNFAGAEKLADTNAAQFNRQFYRASSGQ